MLARIKALSNYFREEYKQSFKAAILSEQPLFSSDNSGKTFIELPTTEGSSIFLCPEVYQETSILSIYLSANSSKEAALGIVYFLAELQIPKVIFLSEGTKTALNQSEHSLFVINSLLSVDNSNYFKESPFCFPPSKFIGPNACIDIQSSNYLYAQLISKTNNCDRASVIVTEKSEYLSLFLENYPHSLWYRTNSSLLHAFAYFQLSIVWLINTDNQVHETTLPTTRQFIVKQWKNSL